MSERLNCTEFSFTLMGYSFLYVSMQIAIVVCLKDIGIYGITLWQTFPGQNRVIIRNVCNLIMILH